nr:transglutaminase domain-containing protein [Paenibacillus sp. MMS18-CY102]
MKKILSIFLLVSMASMLLAACTTGNETVVKPEEPPIQETVKTSGVTVFDLKKKYGSEQDKALMPMYNVPRDKVFRFEFHSPIWEDTNAVTVHTDIKAEEKSRITTMSNYPSIGDTNVLEVSSVWPVLPAIDPSNEDYEKGWGNAPIYYIRINYDMDATTLTKLKKPIIIPFTVKSDVEVPNLKYSISSDGRFRLNWTEVEGADEYRIYQRSKYLDSDAITNLPVPGAEERYGEGTSSSVPGLIGAVKGTELKQFRRFIIGQYNEDNYNMLDRQNEEVNGDYYVTAVKNGKESSLSNSVSTFSLSAQLPSTLSNDSFMNLKLYDNAASLPKKAKIIFIDGSVASRDVIYDTNVKIKQDGDTEIPYTIKNTIMRGFVYVQHVTEADLKALAEAKPQEEDSTAGLVETENTTNYVPNPDVPTVIEAPSSSAEQAESVEEAQKKNTKQKVDEGNQQFVPAPEVIKDIKINADTALEEYLAINMLDVQENISLQAFPEAQNYEAISDVMQEVVYQNPLILDLKGWRYDYDTLTLKLKYEEPADAIKSKQEEIVAEANKVVATIIKPNMSEEQKHKAIYDYLNDNTKYDRAALANAKSNEFKKVDAKFNDSFSTYGIMVKKVGVCASYAAAYKMLSDLAGLEAIVVTGDMDGVPHAWNKVKLANGWVNVDSTNNATNSGVPYLLYNSSDKIAESLNFTLSKEFWRDTEISNFAAKDGSKDYYVANKLEAKSLAEFGSKLSKQLKTGNTHIVIRLGAKIDRSDIVEEAKKAISGLPADKQEEVSMGSLSNYIVVRR